MEGLTAALARFASGEPPRLPDHAVAIIRSGFIDTIATMIAGREEPVVQIVRRRAQEKSGAAGEASILLGGDRLPTSEAALVNGTAGHALDYDDVALAGHPSTVLVPAVLAEAERLGSSGLDAIRAYAVGYEVWAELLSREQDHHHEKGWHPTAVLGPVAAAAAVAHLRKLDFARTRHALALAASFSSGLVANFGTMTKPFHAGRAASAGIEAVALAEAGLTAAPDALEHRVGYLAALSPKGNVDRESPAATLGKELRLLESGLCIKKYPACYGTHRVIDATLDLMRQHDLRADKVKHATATIGRTQSAMLRNREPVTGLEAKFSLEFAVAAPLVAGKVGLAELDDAFVKRPELRETMRKVERNVVDTSLPEDPIFALADRVVIETTDGKSYDSGDVRFARGHAKLPLTADDIEAKFMDCARGANRLDARRLYGRLAALEKLDDVRKLVQ